MISWGADGTARVFDATAGTEVSRQMHLGRVDGGAFSHDGGRVLSWGNDGTARVWDVQTGSEIVRQVHVGPVRGAMFAPDGRLALSWAADGTVRLWDVSWSAPRSSNSALIAEVCEKVLPGPEVALTSSFVNGRGDTITHASYGGSQDSTL